MINPSGRRYRLFAGLAALCAIILTSACGIGLSASPLRITSATIKPDPVVGRIVTLRIEVVSTKDQPQASIVLYSVPQGIRLISGDGQWTGSLAAGQPQVYETSLCVVEPGDWHLRFEAATRYTADGGTDGRDPYLLVIQSDETSGRVIQGADYRYAGHTQTRTPQDPVKECLPP